MLLSPCVYPCYIRLWSNVLTASIYLSLSGESVVPELDRSSVLLSATSHLLLSRKSLPHDAAGETPAVFHLEVHPPASTHKHTLSQTLRDYETNMSTERNNCVNNSEVQLATWFVHNPSATHLLNTPWEINSSQPELSCRPVQHSHRDGCLPGALQRLALCPRLDGGSSLIAIKSRSGSPVTFPLSCNQSGRELMRPGHRLSISLTHKQTHTNARTLYRAFSTTHTLSCFLHSFLTALYSCFSFVQASCFTPYFLTRAQKHTHNTPAHLQAISGHDPLRLVL